MLKNKKYSFLIILFVCSIIIITSSPLIQKAPIDNNPNAKIMPELSNLSEAINFSNSNSLNLNIKYTYDAIIPPDSIIFQSINSGEDYSSNSSLDIVLSLGPFDSNQMQQDNINELGNVPIMMYHGIVNKPSAETPYTGGNVDKDGYNRTAEAFRQDLEFYYQNNYRMIRLEDYIHGKILTEYGKSPLILTFDDGNENNLKVIGLDDDENIIIDPNSAVGILEEFKKKYPDFNVTATFFVNDGLFQQPQYNEKILNWLVENNYDIGNHTKGHIDIKKSSPDIVNDAIGYVYQQLNDIIPQNYVSIIALPFGSPYSKEHENFTYVLNSTYNGINYKTEAALRVGWEPELSPFHKNFDPVFLKRCRAYDNNGKEFDIEMVFNRLETTKYISDGNPDTLVIPQTASNLLNSNLNIEILTY